jgi:hypothetical protein
MLDREPETATGTDQLLGELLSRIATSRVVAANGRTVHSLVDAPHDLVALLEGDDATWSLRHRRGVWTIRKVGERTQIRKLAEAYRVNPDDMQTASSLGAALFSMADIPTDGSPLVVLLDHDLAEIALAGLRLNNKYLVEQATLEEVLAPELLFQRASTHEWETSVVLGDPKGDLPAAASEARFVGKTLDVSPYLQTTATRAALMNSKHARVLHIAAHSRVDRGRAELTFSDGVVSTRDIVEGFIAPRLAVVASCNSDAGDDPMSSLVSAFLAAGTAAVIGSKRSIDDHDTELLIRDFYRAGGVDDPAGALATAQRLALARRAPPHTWSALSCFGTGARAIPGKNDRND